MMFHGGTFLYRAVPAGKKTGWLFLDNLFWKYHLLHKNNNAIGRLSSSAKKTRRMQKMKMLQQTPTTKYMFSCGFQCYAGGERTMKGCRPMSHSLWTQLVAASPSPLSLRTWVALLIFPMTWVPSQPWTACSLRVLETWPRKIYWFSP